MKTIGLLGGMSWESTQTYYRVINQGVKQKLGGLHSAQIAMYSVDFETIEKLQQRGDWDAAAALLAAAARRIELAGADFLLICTNTMHKVAPQVEAAIGIPLLHIADATAEEIRRHGMQTVGLLGTAFTMEQAFYKGRLEEKHGLRVIVPEADDRQTIHRVIYEELCLGEINKDSRQQFLRIIETLRQQGAQAVILGCTEIGLLISQAETDMTLIDTTLIHAQAAVQQALMGSE